MLFIHDDLIEQTGGSHGVRDPHGLASAIGRPRAGLDDTEFYPDVFTKAAALMSSMIKNHPFVDGNKRTGITAAGVFLEVNGWYLVVSQGALEDFTVRVATEQLSVETVAAWLQQGCRDD